MLKGLGSDSMNLPLGWLKASLVRRTVFAAILFFLITTPLGVVLAAVKLGSNLHRAEQFTPLYFPIWAVFSVWVVLDSPALLGLLGSRPDPFGPKALQVSALGIANLVVMFLFLILTKGK